MGKPKPPIAQQKPRFTSTGTLSVTAYPTSLAEHRGKSTAVPFSLAGQLFKKTAQKPIGEIKSNYE